LAQLKADGKIRWYGISTNNWDAIRQLMVFGPIHVLQVGYNLLERSADELLRWAKDEEIGTLIRVPLAKGMLSGKYSGDNAATLAENDLRYARFNQPETVDGLAKLPQLDFLATPERSLVQASLRFVLDHPGVSCVIAGAKNRRQIEENAASSDSAAAQPCRAGSGPAHRRYHPDAGVDLNLPGRSAFLGCRFRKSSRSMVVASRS
jgi:myo-inositol catabolism protein IolS